MTTSPSQQDCEVNAKSKGNESVRQGAIVRAESSVGKVQEWAGANKDGQWGKETSREFQQKLETYQKEHGLDVNGKYDAKTAEAMRKDEKTKDVAAALDEMSKRGVLQQVYRPVDHSKEELSCKAPQVAEKKAGTLQRQGQAQTGAIPKLIDLSSLDQNEQGLRGTLKLFNEELQKQLCEIQEKAHIPKTGKYDPATREMMQKNPQYAEGVRMFDQAMKDGTLNKDGSLNSEAIISAEMKRRSGKSVVVRDTEHSIGNSPDWLKGRPDIAAQPKANSPFADMLCHLPKSELQGLVWRSTDPDHTVTMKGPAIVGKGQSQLMQLPFTIPCTDLGQMNPSISKQAAPPGKAASEPHR